VSLVPELGLLENKLRFSADTFSTDARARFSQMMLVMVRTFATQGSPLVLLLDDIQWIDAASLQTLKHLLVTCGSIPLLVVVAHRDIGSLSDAFLQNSWRACRRRRRTPPQSSRSRCRSRPRAGWAAFFMPAAPARPISRP
jgi:predicted ATPase